MADNQYGCRFILIPKHSYLLLTTLSVVDNFVSVAILRLLWWITRNMCPRWHEFRGDLSRFSFMTDISFKMASTTSYLHTEIANMRRNLRNTANARWRSKTRVNDNTAEAGKDTAARVGIYCSNYQSKINENTHIKYTKFFKFNYNSHLVTVYYCIS